MGRAPRQVGAHLAAATCRLGVECRSGKEDARLVQAENRLSAPLRGFWQGRQPPDAILAGDCQPAGPRRKGSACLTLHDGP
jgi:hypothetical protein